MQKEQVMQFHAIFAKIKDEIKKKYPKIDAFKEYEEFGVFPDNTDKSIHEHKKALFLLAKEICILLHERKLDME